MSAERRVAKTVGYDGEVVLVDGVHPVRREWAESQDWIDVEERDSDE
jgi:hypothetical protein